MFQCKACGEPVGQADLENGFCPHCGASFEDDQDEDASEEQENT